MTSSNEGPLAKAYREWRRGQSASAIYAEPQAPAPRPQIYVQSDYDISQYQSRPAAAVTDRKPGESDTAYEMRMSIWGKHAQADVDQADARARAEQAALSVMHGRGLDGTHGMFSADERQAYRDYATGTRADGQPIVRSGHLAADVLSTGPSLSMLDRLPRKDVPMIVRPAIPASSGDGWSVSR